jgi:hypothetical protein
MTFNSGLVPKVRYFNSGLVLFQTIGKNYEKRGRLRSAPKTMLLEVSQTIGKNYDKRGRLRSAPKTMKAENLESNFSVQFKF